MVQLFKDQLLGVGCYGAVCKAKSGDLLCAAKIINPNLLDPTLMYRIQEKSGDHTSWNETKWFQKESKFLFELRHPTLVQYLGLCQDPETSLPVVLMELMEDNLTHYLKAPRAIPHHVQVDICLDVAQALSYLHSNCIIHKNLCSNNVLLDEHGRAKVTDFGMATLADLNPHNICFPFLAVREKQDYFPPEALKDEPVYTEKMDCFSFGVIVIQILTRLPPKPGNRWKSVTINKPQLGLPRNWSVPVPEVERRQNHIGLIGKGLPLLSVALECLRDANIERPSAEELSSRISTLKNSSVYADSFRSSQESSKSVVLATNSKDQEIIVKLKTKVEQLTKELAQKDHTIAKSQEEAGILKKRLQEMHIKSTRSWLDVDRSQLKRQHSDSEVSRNWQQRMDKPTELKHSSMGQNGTCSGTPSKKGSLQHSAPVIGSSCTLVGHGLVPMPLEAAYQSLSTQSCPTVQ